MESNKNSQTEVTDKVLEESKKIPGEELQLIIEIIRYIHKNYKLDKDSRIAKRTRIVDDIINTKTVSGCTDYAHLFIALCKSKNIDSIFIDVIEKDWIKNPTKEIKGHVFVKVKLKEQAILVDPARGNINVLNMLGRYEILKKGNDFLSMYDNLENFKKEVEKLKENLTLNEK